MKCCLLLIRSRTATTPARRSRSIATRHKENDGDVEGRVPVNGTKDGGKGRSRQSESNLIVQARHTLRAILRECSYLPDPSSRTYLAQHALARFRVYRLRNDVNHKTPGIQDRLQMQHHQARKALNHLQRANDGELGPLYKTLALTYGRVGKRRHELLQPFLPVEGHKRESLRAGDGARDGGEATQKDTELEQPPTGRKRNMKPLPELTPQLRALVASQLSACPPAISRSELHQARTLEPQIPELNSWMRPMPKVRVANLTRRWYAEVLDRLLPPLPLREWNMLRDLAIGKQTPSPSPPRRRAALAQREISERRISKPLEDLVLFNKITRPPAADRNVHAITARYMRRMYAKLFSECSLMEWHDGQWKVTWGHNAMVPGHG